MKIKASFIMLVLPVTVMAQSVEQKTFTKLDLCEIGGFYNALGQPFLEELARAQIYSSFPSAGFEFFAGPCVTATAYGRGVGEKSSKASDDYSQRELEILHKSMRFKDLILRAVLRQADFNVPE